MVANKEWWKPEAPWPKREISGKRVAILGGRLIDGNGGPVVDKPVILLKARASRRSARRQG